eukprot:364896-Chlamydomonas_euryale.AAC.5
MVPHVEDGCRICARQTSEAPCSQTRLAACARLASQLTVRTRQRDRARVDAAGCRRRHRALRLGSRCSKAGQAEAAATAAAAAVGLPHLSRLLRGRVHVIDEHLRDNRTVVVVGWGCRTACPCGRGQRPAPSRATDLGDSPFNPVPLHPPIHTTCAQVLTNFSCTGVRFTKEQSATGIIKLNTINSGAPARWPTRYSRKNQTAFSASPRFPPPPPPTVTADFPPSSIPNSYSRFQPNPLPACVQRRLHLSSHLHTQGLTFLSSGCVSWTPAYAGVASSAAAAIPATAAAPGRSEAPATVHRARVQGYAPRGDSGSRIVAPSCVVCRCIAAGDGAVAHGIGRLRTAAASAAANAAATAAAAGASAAAAEAAATGACPPFKDCVLLISRHA